MNFFELHHEHVIAYKLLSDADLGTNTSSHQTHIGLKEDVLTFLSKNADIPDALLLYNYQCKILPLYFNYITNPDGSIRSPKIRKGTKDETELYSESSIVDEIRKIASFNPQQNWYLLWFGLKSNQPVFLLFDNNSLEFKQLSNLGIDFNKNQKLIKVGLVFEKLSEYLKKYMTKNSEEIFGKIIADVGMKNPLTISRIQQIDVAAANTFFKNIGNAGEELVNAYLAKQKQQSKLVNFNWNNKNRESYQPYDFTIEEKDGFVIFLDVKTTTKDFQTDIHMSDSEIKFVADPMLNNQYHIYRVFSLNLDNKKATLKICQNPKGIITNVNNYCTSFQKNLNNIKVNLSVADFSFSPKLITKVSNDISLQ